MPENNAPELDLRKADSWGILINSDSPMTLRTGPTPAESVRPQRDLSRDRRPSMPNPPSSSNPLAPEDWYVGDDSLERLMDDTVRDPKFYDIRLFAKEQRRDWKGNKKGPVRWTYSRSDHINLVTAEKITSASLKATLSSTTQTSKNKAT